MRFTSVTSLVIVYLWVVKAVQHRELSTVYHFNGELWQSEPVMPEWHSSFHNVRPIQSLRLREFTTTEPNWSLCTVKVQRLREFTTTEPNWSLCTVKVQRPREFTTTEPNWSLCTMKVQRPREFTTTEPNWSLCIVKVQRPSHHFLAICWNQ